MVTLPMDALPASRMESAADMEVAPVERPSAWPDDMDDWESVAQEGTDIPQNPGGIAPQLGKRRVQETDVNGEHVDQEPPHDDPGDEVWQIADRLYHPLERPIGDLVEHQRQKNRRGEHKEEIQHADQNRVAHQAHEIG